MCDRGGDRTPDRGAKDGRRKLWEIDPRLHCSIVGTCLTLGELRKIGRKLNLVIPNGTEEYDVYGHFASAASKSQPIAKSMQKTLERKFRTPVRRFKQAMTEKELRELWDCCMSQGEVPGPYWAIVTHPVASEALTTHVFGEVHMLSRLVGALNRADIRRLKGLEVEKATLTERVEKTKRCLSERAAEFRGMLARHAAEIHALNAHLADARSAEERLKAAEERLRGFEDGGEYRSLWRTTTKMKRRLADQTRDTEQAEARRARQEPELSELGKSEERLGEALRDNKALRENLDDILRSRFFYSDDLGAGREKGQQGPSLDLGGRKIVYVGGRTGAIRHFRSFVERANGTFLHHDGGGIENAFGRLTEILAKGDAVLCPVDCVSHSACPRAKLHCKQNAKTFIPLRGAGLSSFISGLQVISTTPPKHA